MIIIKLFKPSSIFLTFFLSGKLELSPENLDAGQPQWFPLKGAKSGALLLNTEFLAPGDIPSVETSGSKPIKGNRK